jgi:hypothetical protein
MGIAQGTSKQLRYKKQTAFGTIATTAGGQQLRRVTSNLELTKNAYRSNEIRPDMQRADYRHGTKMVGGTIAGELSVGTYKDFMESFCRQTWQVAATTGSQSIGFAAAGMTRGAGSFLTDGFKIGDIVRATGFSNATLNTRNFMVTNVTATALDGFFLDGTANATLAAAAGVTVALVGKKTWVPESGHTNDCYTFEHFFSDLGESEVFDSCRIGTLNLNLPATGFATIEVGVTGRDMLTQTGAYFGTPTAVSTGTGLVAVNGAIIVDGTKVGNITGMTIQGNGNASTGEVVGSNVTPDVFMGAVDVSGQVTAYFDSVALRDKFINETEASIAGVFVADNTANAGFTSFVMSRVKFGGASKDDGEKGLTLTLPYTALKNTAGGAAAANLATTISIQDSSVV